MPYPYQITGSEGVNPQYPAAHLGPYESGSALYVVMPNIAGGVTGTIRVWKSTDAGVTWTEQDTANRPTCSASQYDVQVVLAGTTLYIAYLNTSNAVNIKPFAMATDLWGSNISGGPTPSINAFDPVSPQARKFALARRSDGSYVVMYQANETISFTTYGRIYYATYNGTVWSGGTQVDTNNSGLTRQSGLIGCALGASDLVHFLWFDENWWAYITRSLSSAGSLSSLFVNVYSELALSPYGMAMCAPVSYTDDCGNVVIAMGASHYNLGSKSNTAPTTCSAGHIEFRSEADARIRKEAHPDTTDGPADDTASGDDPAMSVLWDDGVLYAFWASKGAATGATYKIMHAANEGAGWGAAVQLADLGSGNANRITRVHARKIAAGVGIVIGTENASSTYLLPHYWQGSISATGLTPCSGGAAVTYARGGFFSF
jgi:hypothetical protein